MTGGGSEQQRNKINKSRISGELAKKITNGDRVAGNEFVQINYRWLLFIVRRKFTHSNNHEDIVQDTFMLVINKLQKGSINNPNTILAYLRTAAINIGFEYLRKDKKFRSAIDQDLLDVIEDAQDDVLSTLIWEDRVEYVKQVMAELKIQRDKDILIKFYFKDQDKPSICTELNLSTEHFDKVLYRAKQRLKQLIEKKGDDHKPKGKVNSFNANRQNKKSSDNLILRAVYRIKVIMKIFFNNVVGSH